MTSDDVALHVGPAQVHVAILQAHVFAHVHLSSMGNGGVRDSLRIQILEATTSISPVAQVGVDGRRRAWRHFAFHGDHVFGPHQSGTIVNRRVDVFVEYHLRHAIAVAQVTKITPP